jgi:hypothetical protein
MGVTIDLRTDATRNQTALKEVGLSLFFLCPKGKRKAKE